MSSTRSMPALPAGFRFHPTDEELIFHYLMNQAASIPCPVPIIAEVNIYHWNPWDLPAKAVFGENEWYFFSPRHRKYPNGARPNRAAGSGYWKATGTDKAILSTPTGESIGVKKALVFYKGKPPRGVKTDWIMHEYRLTESDNKSTKRRGSSMRLDDWVLCRIYKKSNDFQVSDREQEGSSIVEEESHLVSTAMKTTASASSQKSGAHAGYEDQFQKQAMSKSWSLTDLFNTVDYSALFLDGVLAETDEPQQQIPLIFPTHENQAANNNYYINCHVNNNSTNMSHVDPSDYSSSGNYNGGKRKRIMTLDGAPASSFDDGCSFSKKLQQLPTDSSSWLY